MIGKTLKVVLCIGFALTFGQELLRPAQEISSPGGHAFACWTLGVMTAVAALMTWCTWRQDEEEA
ncbi:MAG: hypothetical protein LUC33_04740 [Prevotellaceae bacterium]|nr:hypothetical protein [Prevotellaceae bacterium]